MPQEMQILRCYSCEIFQVHIVKKSLKWECKICGEKQSIKKVYGKGSGKDCRLNVQQLNQKCLEIDAQTSIVDEPTIENTRHFDNTLANTITKSNRWGQFMPVATGVTDSEIHVAADDTYERPCKRQKYIQNQDSVITNNASNDVSTKVETNSLDTSRLCHESHQNETNIEHLFDVSSTTSKSKWDEFIISTLDDLTNEDCKFLDDHNMCESSRMCFDESKNLHFHQTNEDLNIANINHVLDQSTAITDNHYQEQTLFSTSSQISPSECNTGNSYGILPTKNGMKSEEGLQLFDVGENDLDAILSF